MRKTFTATIILSLGLAMTGCSEGQDDDPEPEVDDREYAVLIRGELITEDAADARGIHDGIARGGEELAQSLGDFGHDALVGADLIGTVPRDFMALDRWDNLEGIDSFYFDPAFAEAAGALYSAPPTLEVFAHAPDWHGWGDLRSGDGFTPYTFVVIRGRLAEADPEMARTGHDAVAAGGEELVRGAGDVAHVVFLGVDDPQEFLAVDIWSDDTALVGVYTDPQFAEAFSGLYEAPPSLQVYRSTDWYQW